MKSNKYSFIVILLVLVAILMGGCIEGEVYIGFNLDGSADLELEILAPSMGMLGGELDIFGEMKSELENEGFTVEEHQDNGMEGIKAFRNVDDLEEFGELSFLEEVDTPEPDVEEGFFFTTYTIDQTFSLDDAGLGGDGQMLSMLGGSDLDFTLEFPISPLEHNADKISDDGRQLTWVVDLVEENHIGVVVNVPNIWAIVLLILGIIAVAVVVVILIKRKRIKE